MNSRHRRLLMEVKVFIQTQCVLHFMQFNATHCTLQVCLMHKCIYEFKTQTAVNESKSVYRNPVYCKDLLQARTFCIHERFVGEDVLYTLIFCRLEVLQVRTFWRRDVLWLDVSWQDVLWKDVLQEYLLSNSSGWLHLVLR